MVINLRQNTNDDSTAFGNKIADYQMCVLVLGQVVECMSELLSQGQPVKLDGLGTFSPSVDGQGNGKNDMETAVAVGPDAMINGIKINFVPENTKGEKLTSRAFKEQCIFEYGYSASSSTATWFRARSAPSTASSAACRRRRRSPTSWLRLPTTTVVAVTAKAYEEAEDH